MDLRKQAFTDPRGFLNDLGSFVILDEVQRVPELFSYLQEIVDSRDIAAQYILTGSAQFLLIESIAQSLAGRIISFKLYPLTFTELFNYPEDKKFESIFQEKHSARKKMDQESLYNLMWKGFYPRLHDKNVDSDKWYENYIMTYAERDIRSLINVKDLRTFESFLTLCASQSAQLMNYSNLANSLGVSVPTIREWISIMETSGIIFILTPYFKNFSKRIVKTPKLYFVDTGLLCHLLSIRNVVQLKTHPLLGSIFETFIVSECFKRFLNRGDTPPLYFWRDQTGNEIDLLIQYGELSFPIEIKLAQSFNPDFKKSIQKWMALDDNPSKKGVVAYCGEHIFDQHKNVPTMPWYVL